MSKKGQNNEDTEEKEYQVEMILDRKINADDCYFYQVKWVGYSQTTWEPLSNLLGGEVVQKMITDFEKNLEKKNKNNWTNGLAGWANLSKKKNNENNENSENIDKNNLCTFNHKTDDLKIIDLEKELEQKEHKKKKFDENFFIGSQVKRKITSIFNERYPFEKEHFIEKRPCFMKKVSEIKKIEIRQNESKCLVKWKAPDNDQEWILTDIIRVMVPEMLVNAYQKLSQHREKINVT